MAIAVTTFTTPKRLKMAIFGKSNIGKTFLIRELATEDPKKGVLVLDFENGGVCLENYPGIYRQDLAGSLDWIPRGKELQKTLDEISSGVLEALLPDGRKIPIEIVVIDSLSKWTEREFERLSKEVKDNRRVYGQLKADFTKRIDKLLDQNHYNIIILGGIKQVIQERPDKTTYTETIPLAASESIGTACLHKVDIAALMDVNPKGERVFVLGEIGNYKNIPVKNRYHGKLLAMEPASIKGIARKIWAGGQPQAPAVEKETKEEEKPESLNELLDQLDPGYEEVDIKKGNPYQSFGRGNEK